MHAERRKQSRAAAEWASENGVGARKACSSGKFGDVTYNMVHPLLKELKDTGSIAADRDHAKQRDPSGPSRPSHPLATPLVLYTVPQAKPNGRPRPQKVRTPHQS